LNVYLQFVLYVFGRVSKWHFYSNNILRPSSIVYIAGPPSMILRETIERDTCLTRACLAASMIKTTPETAHDTTLTG